MTLRTIALIAIVTACLGTDTEAQTAADLTDEERQRVERFLGLSGASTDAAPKPVGDTVEEKRAAYVDTSNNKRCPDAPLRPGWVMIHDWTNNTHGEKFEIGRALYTPRASEHILDLGECTCELRFPAWDPMRAEYEVLIAPLETQEQAKAVKRSMVDAARVAWREAKPLCDAWW